MHALEFISGKARNQQQINALNELAVGDRVVFTEQFGSAVIDGMIKRRTRLSRLKLDYTRDSVANATEQVIAANVDIAIIVASVVHPSFNPGLIDRYLVICNYGNVKPIICLTKIDKGSIPDMRAYEKLGIKVFAVSNETKEGMSELMSFIEGKTCVLVGNSGVGKSSLINSMLQGEVLLTGEVSSKSGKGKHTTSSSSLHVIGNSTFIIDTPGIRALSLKNIEKEALHFYFPEFAQFSEGCEFNDCTHSHEPKCAVKDAVNAGMLSKERYASYVRILNDE